MKKIALACLLIASIISLRAHEPVSQLEQEKFLTSFIKTYEFNASGRYAHEYHPFILSKTAQSMHELEGALANEGMNFVGRYVLMGYEANAFERFLPRLSDCEGLIIDDEASVKDAFRGWPMKLHNKFGATTGFLFRQLKSAQPGSVDQFQHVNPGTVEVYGLGLNILQEVTFGKIWPTLFSLESIVYQSVTKGLWKEALETIIRFWEKLYSGEISIDSDGQGTQDILFAIENARFINSSMVDLVKFYTGADITYPISTSKLCSSGATKNAQSFLKVFIKELTPKNDKNTLFVFRSFVDGVGKSTLLGNIINYLKYGTNVDKYQAVDNTSSQDFELFQFNDPEHPYPGDKTVFIADMPAQMSHFVCKPEGMVYVDVAALCKDQTKWAKQFQYFYDNQESLVESFTNLHKEIQKLHGSGAIPKGWCFDVKNAARALACNLVLLKEQSPLDWIPFTYLGQSFLAKNNGASKELRILLDIKDARSEGLKNASAAQMIFSKGVSLPASYQLFLDKFVKAVKEKGIESVAFVDFLSMYSRSSRENIRINYILQAIAHINNSLSVERSPYKHLVSDSEFLYMLEQPEVFADVLKFLSTESLLRLILHQLMCKGSFDSQTSIDSAKMQTMIDQEFANLSPAILQHAHSLCNSKINSEHQLLKKIHGQSKEFLNVYTLDFSKLLEFSDFLAEFFESKVKNTRINRLWENSSGALSPELEVALDLNHVCRKFESVSTQDYVLLDNGQKMRVLAYFSGQTRDLFLIDKVVKTLRVGWNFALLNLLAFNAFDKSDNSLSVPDEIIRQLPVVLKQDSKGNFWMLEKFFEAGEVMSEVMSDGSTDYYGVTIDGGVYLFDYYFKNTEFGFLGLGYLNASMQYYYAQHSYFQNYIAEQFFKEEANKKNAMSYEKVWQDTSNDVFATLNYFKTKEKSLVKVKSAVEWCPNLQQNVESLSEQLDKHGYSDLQCDEKAYQGSEKKSLHKLLLASEESNSEIIDGFNFVSSMFATLHFLLRDPQSIMAPHKKTLAEFQAVNNIFRFVAVPQYLGIFPIISHEDEFNTPVIPMDYEF